jgi:hypothetical protein
MAGIERTALSDIFGFVGGGGGGGGHRGKELEQNVRHQLVASIETESSAFSRRIQSGMAFMSGGQSNADGSLKAHAFLFIINVAGALALTAFDKGVQSADFSSRRRLGGLVCHFEALGGSLGAAGNHFLALLDAVLLQRFGHASKGWCSLRCNRQHCKLSS